MTTIETLFNLQKAMKENKGKGFVYERFQDYLNAYDNLDEPTIEDKIRHRDIFYIYTGFMTKENKK